MKKLVGLFASVALMTSGAALAQTQSDTSQQGSSSSSMQQGSSDLGTGSSQDQGVGGSGSSSGSQGSMGGSQGSMGSSQGSMGQMNQLGSNQLTGQVLKSDKSNVFIKGADGAIISLKVDKKTQFTDPNVKSAKSLQPGQEIRASFKVQGTDNVATSIEPSTGGMGGSGAMQPDTGINQPSQPGSGGSGSMDQGSSGMEKGSSGSDISGSQNQGSQKGY